MLLKFNSDVSLRNAVRREGHHPTDHTAVVSWNTRTAMDQNVVYTVSHMLATRVRSSESIPMLPNGLCSSCDTHNIPITEFAPFHCSSCYCSVTAATTPCHIRTSMPMPSLASHYYVCEVGLFVSCLLVQCLSNSSGLLQHMIVGVSAVYAGATVA